MKVLHINSYYSEGGFYKNLYDTQIKNGVDIDVYVPVSLSYDESTLKFGDYTLISKNHIKYDRMLFHVKHDKIYRDIIKRYNIDNYSIIHAHSLFSNGYIAFRLKKNYGVPYIVAVRNTDVNIFFKYMFHLKNLGIKILKEAKYIIFLSESYQNIVINKYIPVAMRQEIIKKAKVIPNGIDDFWHQNIGNPKFITKNNSINLLYVGAINKNKNLLTTIKAITHLQNRDYLINFTIVGNIEDYSLHNKIKNIPYLNYIYPKPKEELITIYQLNDIFIMPSKTETFGLVYAEAMSQGLPVIYSKGQGFDKQFEEGIVGYHVDCFNSHEVADRVEDILHNYGIISNNCINNVGKFNWNYLAKEYINIYS